jgi:predicted nucleic acid-binding protein
LILADTSVTVAAALPWHASHRPAAKALPPKAPLIAHVAVETHSVLTRLPPPARVPAWAARRYLAETFEFPPLALAPDSYEELLDLVTEEGIAGGAVYDAVVAVTARALDATLVSLDRRAASTYSRLGIDYRMIGAGA